MAVPDHAEDPEPCGPFPTGLPFLGSRPRPLDRWNGSALARKATEGWTDSACPPTDVFGNTERDPWILVWSPDGPGRPGEGF